MVGKGRLNGWEICGERKKYSTIEQRCGRHSLSCVRSLEAKHKRLKAPRGGAHVYYGGRREVDKGFVLGLV